MKRTLQKLLSCLLVLLLALSLAACAPAETPAPDSGAADGGTTDDGGAEAPAADSSSAELYQVEMFNTYANYMGVQSGWYGKIIKDKFNIELNIIAPNVAGTGDALYQTRTAAGNLGDIIIQTQARMVDCQKAGLLLDISSYLEDAPNLQKLDAGIQNLAKLIGGDGIYAIPGRVSTSAATEPAGRGVNPEAASFIRWDWYYEAGAPEIQNMDHLLEVLAQICEAHPTNENGDKVYAFSLFKDWDGDSVRAAREMMYLYGYGPAQGYYWMNNDGSEVVNILDDGSMYYDMLKLYNTAYTMGILDPDSSTQNWDMFQSKAKDGRVLFVWWPWVTTTIHDRFDMETGMPMAYVPIADSVVNNPGYSPYGMEGLAFAIGSGAKYPERLIEFLDWYASPEGVMYNNGQVEGVTYEMVDGRPVLTEFALDPDPNKEAPADLGGGNWTEGSCQINYPLVHQDDVNSVIGEPTNSNLWTSTIENNANEYNQQWAELYGTNSPLDYLETNNMIEVAPGTDYTTPSEPSDITTMRAQLREIVTAAGWQMIYAADEAEFDALWTDMKAQLPDFGYNEVLAYDMEIVNDMIEARQRVLGGAE